MILCLETSTAVCSVALVKDGNVVALRESLDGQNHAEKITIFIEPCPILLAIMILKQFVMMNGLASK